MLPACCPSLDSQTTCRGQLLHGFGSVHVYMLCVYMLCVSCTCCVYVLYKTCCCQYCVYVYMLCVLYILCMCCVASYCHVSVSFRLMVSACVCSFMVTVIVTVTVSVFTGRCATCRTVNWPKSPPSLRMPTCGTRQDVWASTCGRGYRLPIT